MSVLSARVKADNDRIPRILGIARERKKSGGLRAASARDREDLGQRRGAPVIMGPGVRPPFMGLERLGVSNQLQVDVVENGCGGRFALASSNSADGERQRLFEIDGRDRQSPGDDALNEVAHPWWIGNLQDRPEEHPERAVAVMSVPICGMDLDVTLQVLGIRFRIEPREGNEVGTVALGDEPRRVRARYEVLVIQWLETLELFGAAAR